MKPPRTIGIAAHTGKVQARQRLDELLRLLRRRRCRTLLEPGVAMLLGRAGEAVPLEEFGRRADVVVALGGDGTMLRVVRALDGAPTPILGVNLGHLGFLTSVRSPELRQVAVQMLRGECAVTTRTLLLATVRRRGRRVAAHRALNDAVLSRSAFSRIVRLQLGLDGELLTEYLCDGIIFATATGSTAYSLSAGGPILQPTMRAFAMTPICPHALSNRSVIAGEDSVARCQVASAAGELLLTIDGQVQVRLQVGDTVEIRRARETVRLLTPPGHSYFGVLRQKLKWSGANV